MYLLIYQSMDNKLPKPRDLSAEETLTRSAAHRGSANHVNHANPSNHLYHSTTESFQDCAVFGAVGLMRKI